MNRRTKFSDKDIYWTAKFLRDLLKETNWFTEEESLAVNKTADVLESILHYGDSEK